MNERKVPRNMSDRVTALKERIRNRSIVQKEDLLVFMGGVLLAFAGVNEFSLLFVLPYFAFWYQRSSVQFFIAILGAICGSAYFGLSSVYLMICLSVVMWLLITLVQLIQQNVYIYLPIIVTVSMGVSQIFLFTSVQNATFVCALAYFATKYSIRDVSEVDSSFRLSEMIFGGIILALVSGSQILIPGQYVPYLLVYVYMVFARIFKTEHVLLLLAIGYFVFGWDMMGTIWLLTGLMSMIVKEENRIYGIAIFAMVLLFVEINPFHLLVFGSISLLYLVTPFTLIQEVLVRPLQLDLEPEMVSASKKLLSSQLQQFSGIFQLIRNYYGDMYEQETVFLDGMSQAFQNISLEIKQNFLQAESTQQRILRILQAYHYDVVRCKVDEYDRRGLKITLHISSLKKKEAEDVIVPLLSGIVGKQLQMVECYRNYLWNGYHHMEFVVPSFFDIETQAWKVNANEVCSGDTYSVFRHKHSTVCTISDGMGVGEVAMKTSLFVTNLFQKLILSNLSLESAVRCVNKLLQAQNQSFATLDVLYFDHKKKEVYISKSSAASTYLIRDGRVIEISGSSLPIGIIKEVEADCYCMDVLATDLFIMTSDGIEKNIVYKWVNRMRDEGIEECIGQEIGRMEENGVKDDVTVLIARPKEG
ncbi:MAG: SpoIIE family protein phosphatase [Erysipelotrichaceae bacterium]|nr:SpoIIE family protein phosphatase [Erysipelotrichaceae bacterium]